MPGMRPVRTRRIIIKAEISMRTAHTTSPDTAEPVQSEIQPVTYGPKKPPMLDVLISAIAAAACAPVRNRFGRTQKFVWQQIRQQE